MAGLRAVDGGDLVAALVIGGFRISRREGGLALLVRDCDAVVVPERSVLDRPRLVALLQRANIEERDLLSWMSVAAKPASGGTVRSGLHRRLGAPTERKERTLEAVVENANAARVRADAADVDARNALAASRQALEQLPPASPPDDGRIRAVQQSLTRWQDAFRELEEEARRERQKRQR